MTNGKSNQPNPASHYISTDLDMHATVSSLYLSCDGSVRKGGVGESKSQLSSSVFCTRVRRQIATFHTSADFTLTMPTHASIVLQQLLAPYPRDFKNIPTATDYGKGADVEANKSEEMVSE